MKYTLKEIKSAYKDRLPPDVIEWFRYSEWNVKCERYTFEQTLHNFLSFEDLESELKEGK